MEKINVFIIHGAYGYPDENWFAWLRKKLHDLHIECYVPRFPTPNEQCISKWLTLFNQEYANKVHARSILIGHSLGAIFVLRWLEQSFFKPNYTILIGAFLGKVGIPSFDEINLSFFKEPFNWSAIITSQQHFICYHGDNDPYVKRKDVEIISHHLHALKIIVSHGGHFNVASGYTQFPHLWLHIKRLIKEMNNDE